MDNFIGIYDKNQDYSEYETLLIMYKREDFLSVLNTFKDFTFDLDYWFTINWDSNFYDILVFYKTEELSYRPIYLLREVNTPFKVLNKDTGKSEPRGWFFDRKGLPVRYTGLGNSLYFSRSERDEDFSEKALYIFYFCIFKNKNTKSNLKSFTNMLSNLSFYEKSDTMNPEQDNSIKEYEQSKGFNFRGSSEK